MSSQNSCPTPHLRSLGLRGILLVVRAGVSENKGGGAERAEGEGDAFVRYWQWADSGMLGKR